MNDIDALVELTRRLVALEAENAELAEQRKRAEWRCAAAESLADLLAEQLRLVARGVEPGPLLVADNAWEQTPLGKWKAARRDRFETVRYEQRSPRDDAVWP
mgnify:CR=1 FL=1